MNVKFTTIFKLKVTKAWIYLVGNFESDIIFSFLTSHKVISYIEYCPGKKSDGSSLWNKRKRFDIVIGFGIDLYRWYFFLWKFYEPLGALQTKYRDIFTWGFEPRSFSRDFRASSVYKVKKFSHRKAPQTNAPDFRTNIYLATTLFNFTRLKMKSRNSLEYSDKTDLFYDTHPTFDIHKVKLDLYKNLHLTLHYSITSLSPWHWGEKIEGKDFQYFHL